MRKKIAEHMIASRRTSAHVHTVFDVDMTRIVKLREKNRNRFQQSTGLKLTYTPFFIRAVAQGLRAWPIMNSSVEGDNIHYKRDINIGIAVALDWGLLVPVIKHADELSFVGLQRALNDLGERARSKKLKPDEVTRWNLYDHQSGNFWRKLWAADHQPAAGRDSGSRRDCEEAGGAHGQGRQ